MGVGSDSITCSYCRESIHFSRFAVKTNGKRKKVCIECCESLRVRSREHVERLKFMGQGIDGGGRHYDGRDAWVRDIGFSDYHDYLKSGLWSLVRSQVFIEKGRECSLCGRTAEQVHHTRYHRNDLLGNKLDNLHPICSSCHHGIEFVGGRKTTLGRSMWLFVKKRIEFLRRVSVGRPLTEDEQRFIALKSYLLVRKRKRH